MGQHAHRQAAAGAELKPGHRLTAGLCVLACLTMFSYAVASSAAQSLYLSAFGSRALPWAWLGVAIMSVLATSIIATLAERIDIVRLFSMSCWISGVSLVLLLTLCSYLPSAGAYCLYVWKDIYIIVLVELFWTFANVVFAIRSASHIYGWFCAAGSLGSVLGNVVLARLAPWCGTRATLWLVLPLLALIAAGCRRLARNVAVPAPLEKKGMGLGHGLATIRASKVLPWLMLIVAAAQGWLALVDFQFSAAIERASVTELERTAIIANVYAIINAVSLALQMVTGPLLQWFGGATMLLALPGLALASLGWLSAAPGSLVAVATLQTVGKSLDYSFFRATKELLYIPLSYAEKTQGKAVVDILVYRLAKGAISTTLLCASAAGLGAEPSSVPLWLLWGIWTAAILTLLWQLRGLSGFRAFRLRWPSRHGPR